MLIKEVESFDVTGDGMLVLKTNVDHPSKDLRYAWYIMQGKKLLHKTTYMEKPFTTYSLEMPGEYRIKAFVTNGKGEKVKREAKFLSDKWTSPELVQRKTSKKPLVLTPVVQQISGPFWQFSIRETLPKNTQYAWYVFQEGKADPMAREIYSEKAEYIYKFTQPGNYRVKVFVVESGIKYRAWSEPFRVVQ